MNARRVAAAAGVVCAAQKQRNTATGIAAALEAAGLLQSPESAAELVALREDRDGFRTQRNSVFKTNEELLIRVERADLERLQVENENRTLTRRVAELEAQAEKTAAFCAQRAEYVTNLRAFVEGGEHDYYRWTGHAEARRQLSQSLGLPVGWPAEDKQSTPPAPAEDPHDSPLHHTYAVGRDLPEGGAL
ncbi:hypothetical protein ABZ154_03770 [Streptomyces sp. NPDC006261]|uniref:hypothetical protein n=1 Tax=Streptomyces sp. NPDC006261 TaxID=3156739 RepID=UPI0033B2CDCB